MGIFTEVRRSITRLWGRTEQVVGEAYGNEALEYEGEADAAKADAEEATDGRQHGHRAHGRKGSGTDDDGTTGIPAH